METKLVVIINRYGGILAALKIWSSQSSDSLSVMKFFNYLIILERLCMFSQGIIMNNQGFTTVCRY